MSQVTLHLRSAFQPAWTLRRRNPKNPLQDSALPCFTAAVDQNR